MYLTMQLHIFLINSHVSIGNMFIGRERRKMFYFNDALNTLNLRLYGVGHG